MDVRLSEKFICGTDDGTLIEVDLHYDDHARRAAHEAKSFFSEHQDELHAVFEALDEAGDGVITARTMLKSLTLNYEIQKRLKDYSPSLSRALNPKNAVQTLKAIDANQDGQIDADEFAQFAQRCDARWREQHLDDAQLAARCVQLQRWRTILSGHGNFVAALATHPQRQIFATTGFDRTICVWDIELRTLVAKAQLVAPGLSLAFAPAGTMLCCGLASGIVVVFRLDLPSHRNGQKYTLGVISQCALVPQRPTGYGAALALPPSKRKPLRTKAGRKDSGPRQVRVNFNFVFPLRVGERCLTMTEIRKLTPPRLDPTPFNHIAH